MDFQQGLAAMCKVVGCVVIKSRRPYKILDFLDRCLGKVSRCLKMIKHHPGHPIDLFIGALGGKDGGDQELKGCVVIQLGLEVGIDGS